jgi:hypothetical protein
MNSDRISYAPSAEALLEGEISALVAAYRFVLDTAMKEGSRPGAPDAEKGSKHDSRLLKYTR